MEVDDPGKDSRADQINHSGGINPYGIDCGTQKATELTIVGEGPDVILSLCEVEVFSRNPTGMTSTGFNESGKPSESKHNVVMYLNVNEGQERTKKKFAWSELINILRIKTKKFIKNGKKLNI